MHVYISLMIPSLHESPQGIIYSETAAANYGDNPVFEVSTELMPACRLGTPEEVRIFQFYHNSVYRIHTWKDYALYL